MSFYIKGERKRFIDGVYNTEDAEEIEALKKLQHVTYNELDELDSLEALTVKELKERAKEKEIEGYSSMKREELIESLKGVI